MLAPGQLSAMPGLELAGLTTDGLVVAHSGEGVITGFPIDGSAKVEIGHGTFGFADHGVVFVGDFDEKTKLSTLSVYSKKTGRLVSLSNQVFDFRSSDHDRIAFVEKETGGTVSLVLVDADGGNRKVLMSGVFRSEGWAGLRASGRYMFANWRTSPGAGVGVVASIDLETDTLSQLGDSIISFNWNTWDKLYVLFGQNNQKTLVSLAGGPKIDITNCTLELLAMDASGMLCRGDPDSLERVAFPSGERTTLVASRVVEPLDGVGDLVLYSSRGGVVSLLSMQRGVSVELTGYQPSDQFSIERLMPSGQAVWLDGSGTLHARGIDTAEVTFGEKVQYAYRSHDSTMFAEKEGATADVSDLHLVDVATGQSHRVATGALTGRFGYPYYHNASNVVYVTQAGLFVSPL